MVESFPVLGQSAGQGSAGYASPTEGLRPPQASALEFFTSALSNPPPSLGLALVMTSSTPLLLLDDALVVHAASQSFCTAFALDCTSIVGRELFSLGEGEWDIPQLRSLLTAIVSGSAAVEAYELELRQQGQLSRCLILNAHVLEPHAAGPARVVLAISDVTQARASEREKDALVRDKLVLVQELNHRIANSLQIIASVLMQRVRSVQSEEARGHLRDAHHRVMSVATLQRQLASNATGDVQLRRYFTDLCASIGASMIADPDQLCLTVKADDSVTTPDRSVSMGLIVTELVINALKHAFPDPSGTGAITVRFSSDPEGWVLTVADDGIGLVDSSASDKPGLGTGIVNALAAQLLATVEVGDGSPGCVMSIVHRTTDRASRHR